MLQLTRASAASSHRDPLPGVCCLLALTCLVAAPLAGATSLEHAQADALQASASLWAPRAHRQAGRLADEARSLLAAGDDERGRERTAEAVAAWEAAAGAARDAAAHYPAVAAAHQAALALDAALYAREPWERAQRAHRELGHALEQDPAAEAAEQAATATARYREAELDVIELRVLGEARATLAEGERTRAERYMPQTVAQAREALAEAETLLARDRTQTEGAADLARQAINLARWAARMTAAQRDGRDALEAVLIEWRNALETIALAASVDLPPGYSPVAAAAELTRTIEELREQQTVLGAAVEARNAQIRTLQDEITVLETRLGGVARERSELARKLDTRAQVEAQIARIETLFDEREAIVLRERDELVIRLVGLDFDSGSARVQPSQQPLLEKVIAAIAIFPAADVVVEGHTDSRGAADANLTLSRERARSVRAELLAREVLPVTRLSSDGFGEQRPVASNDTSEGRAANRRIDIRIHPNVASSL